MGDGVAVGTGVGSGEGLGEGVAVFVGSGVADGVAVAVAEGRDRVWAEEGVSGAGRAGVPIRAELAGGSVGPASPVPTDDAPMHPAVNRITQTRAIRFGHLPEIGMSSAPQFAIFQPDYLILHQDLRATHLSLFAPL